MLKYPVPVILQIRITSKTNIVRAKTFKHLHQGIGQMTVSAHTNLSSPYITAKLENVLLSFYFEVSNYEF
jgi:hypothetical protein